MHYILIPVLVITLCGSPTYAQNALGDGTSLDGSTSSLGRVNQSNFLPVGVRNSEIRRSNVLQGRDFNQDIGRGTNDNAQLQLLADAASKGGTAYQDALNNSPWYWNNWSSQSSQFLSQGDHSYFNPSFMDNWATAPAQMSSGRSLRSYSHDWSEDSAREFGGDGALKYPDTWSKRQTDQYKLGQVLGGGQPPDTFDTTPIPVGVSRTGDFTGYLAASPMTGVSLESTAFPTSALGFSAWDEARLVQDMQNGIGQNNLVSPWRTQENQLQQISVNNQVDVSDQYNQVLQTISNRAQEETIDGASGDTGSMSWLENRYTLLQNDLTGIPMYGDDSEDGDLFVFEKEDELISDEAIDFLASTLRHGERINQLFSGKNNTRFDELVHLGEEELGKGNYFDAQRRFNQALQFIPGHPLATAGLGHANIGAGLYLSAGYILQSLLSFQPEMIDVEYDASLLPPRIELVRAAVTVQNRLDVGRDAGTYAFLLAYIGHQLHDEDMVRHGLRVLQMYTGAGDPIIPLLKRIWLEQEFGGE